MNPHHIILSLFLRNISFIIIPRHRFCLPLPPLHPQLASTTATNGELIILSLPHAPLLSIPLSLLGSGSASRSFGGHSIRCMYFPPAFTGHVSNGPFCLCSLCISRFGSRIPPTVVKIYIFEIMFSLSPFLCLELCLSSSSVPSHRRITRIVHTYCIYKMLILHDPKSRSGLLRHGHFTRALVRGVYDMLCCESAEYHMLWPQEIREKYFSCFSVH